METIPLTLNNVIQMTQRVGDDWAIAHARRLIELVKQIGVDIPYDRDVMELATYMHLRSASLIVLHSSSFPCFLSRHVR